MQLIIRSITMVSLLLGTLGFPFDVGAKGPKTLDIVIRDARVMDGTGAPWYRADVGVKAGKIAEIGRIDPATAERVIDGSGLVLAPGFIDMMGQTATPMLENPATAMNLLTQGITTINAGEGVSAAPLSAEGDKRFGWTTFAEYFQLIELRGLPVNVAQTVGHTQVRELVLGDVNRRPTADELAKMQALVQEAMDAGAIGFSTALIYPPAVYAETEELVALAKIAGASGGRYFTHMRNEGDKLLDAIDEALQIGREGQLPVHVFHLKAAGQHNWGKMPLAIARIKAARAAGQQVTADIYPYINNGLGIAAFIHPKHFGEGHDKLIRQLDDAALRDQIRKEMETTDGWENWFRHVGHDWNKVIIGQASSAKYAPHVGQSVAAIAKAVKEDPWETFFQLVKTGAFALPQSMSEANVIAAMKEEFISFCTDVGPAGGSSIASHPRAFGALPRVFARYVGDLGAVSWEQAIAQASSVAANELMAYDRGRIAVGQAADLVLFDQNALVDKASFSKPHDLAEGVKTVLVNGVVVLDGGKFTGKTPGKVLRGPGYRKDFAAHLVKSGSSTVTIPAIDRVMASFLERHRVPGVSVAITDHGRLVHASGYGYADIAQRAPVTPTSLFRIASISKPLTAVAIVKLIEEGKLNLDDKVFDILPFEPFLPPGKKVDERQREITIRHLLEHRGGWDRDLSFDAMFKAVDFAKLLGTDPPAGPAEVIKVMSGHPLDFSPGERYAYSNYGYCLLGRVIEKLTEKPYGDYMTDAIFRPMGIKDMHLGHTRIEQRQPNEVRYYDPYAGTSDFAADLHERVPAAYGAWNLEAMDAHGAWLSSAVDLARFACAFDDSEKCPVLKPASIETMFARPPGRAGHDENGKPLPTYYALGWSVTTNDEGKPAFMGHSGSLPGTNTRLRHQADGRNIIVLFNTRTSPISNRVADAAMDEIVETLKTIEQWPDGDLFQTEQ